jgi:hypothetical protein
MGLGPIGDIVGAVGDGIDAAANLFEAALDGAGDLGKLGHAALDVAGMVPGFGLIANGANAAWYAAEGKDDEAIDRAVKMVPYGQIVSGLR